VQTRAVKTAPERSATKPICMGFHQVAYEIGAQTFYNQRSADILVCGTGQTRMSILRDTEPAQAGFVAEGAQARFQPPTPHLIHSLILPCRVALDGGIVNPE